MGRLRFEWNTPILVLENFLFSPIYYCGHSFNRDFCKMSKSRTLVIGDIHSGLRALKQLLDIGKVTADDILIFLGDYVDGWSTAVETIEFLITLRKTHNCIFIRGNHDELCYDWLIQQTDNPTWVKHGGKSTIESYTRANTKTIAKHLLFYEGLENFYLDSENRLFLHAGFTNLKGVEHEYFVKTLYWDRTLWELAQSLHPNMSEDDEFYPDRLKNYKEIYLGHTPVSKTLFDVVPVNAANVWNLDTGAAFKGPLSMMDIDTKEIWQSEPVHFLYPQERGRN
jgi:serine/threonine protein phosphatase 1